jgi:hypothetical protein
MPIDPEDLYSAAQTLNGTKPSLVSDEVCGRTMINRMYYAAYLATRDAVRRQLRISRFDVSHTALADTLADAADSDVRDLGLRLQYLKLAREDADYRPHLNMPLWVAGLYLDDARFVLDNVRRLIGRFPPIQRR